MGYYTQFDLSAVNKKLTEEDIKQFDKELFEISECETVFSGSGDVIKWYDFEKDMKIFSMSHPETLFQQKPYTARSPIRHL